MGNTHSEQDHNAVGQAGAMGGRDNADAAAAAVLGSAGLSSSIELSIACDSLRNMDFGIGNKSDPFVVVYLHRNNEWQEIGRTEIIANQLNPRFVKLIPMMYNFEEVQLLGFKVYDVDTSFTSNNSESIDLSKQDYLGECMCYLAEIMGAAGQTRTMALTDRGQTVQGWGTLTVTAEEMSNQNAIVRLRMRAVDLPKMDFFGKADPFLIFNRLKEDRQGVKKVPCFKTEVKLRTYNPAWDVIEVNIQRLCNGDLYRPILIECYDWDSDGSHDYIGERQVSLNEILGLVTPEAKAARRNELALVHKNKPRNTYSYGSLIFEECAIIPKPTFLDYIAGGCQMNFMVAIDFTASNGDPNTPGTLHYIDPTGQQLNQYQQAILAVGDVLQYYDTDKRYPLWGFGGKPVPGEPANHCFALNGYEDNPEVEGIHGMLAAYSHAVQHVQLAGPTLFANVIGTAAAIAASAESQITQAQQQYFVLLILTDGIINDMDNTISQIVYAANLPLSILIVGVGDADFKAMEVLDGDEERLRNHTGIAARDIVQFTPLREFATPRGIDMSALSRSLLDEIPTQLLSYFEMRNIAPNPRRAPAPSEVMPGMPSQVSMLNRPDAGAKPTLMVAPSMRAMPSHATAPSHHQYSNDLPPIAEVVAYPVP